MYTCTSILCTITKKHIVQRKLEQTSYQYYWGYLSGCWGQINGSRSCRERDRREWEKVNSKTRMCVLGCGRATGWAALVTGLWLGFTLAPLSQILCCYLLGHISTYLHIYRATLCVYQERGGGGLVCSLLTRTRKLRTFPPGFPVLVWAQELGTNLSEVDSFNLGYWSVDDWSLQLTGGIQNKLDQSIRIQILQDKVTK